MITSEFRSRKTFTKRKKCKFTAKLEINQEAWDGDFPTYLFFLGSKTTFDGIELKANTRNAAEAVRKLSWRHGITR